MRNSKLIELYSLMNETELKKLDKFLASPYFNESETICQIHDFVRVFHPDYNHEALKKENLWKELYPTEAFNDNRLRHFMSRLLNLLQRFLAVQHFESDQFASGLHNLKSLRTHGAEKPYLKAYQKFREKLDTEGSEAFLQDFLLDEELNQFYSVSSLVSIHKIDSGLKQSAQNLDLFYLVNKLRYFCAVINYKNILKLEHRNLLMEEIIGIAGHDEFKTVPAVRLYYLILKMLLEPEEEGWFRDLLDELQQFQSFFADEELRGMYVFAQNYCIRKANQGQTSFLQDLFEIYKTVLREGIIFHDGSFSAGTYKNIVAVGLRLKAFNWVEDFIDRYNDRLSEEERENARIYNLARLFFTKRNFEKVIELLQQVNYSDVFYSLDSRSILLKTYYEMDAIEPMYSLIDSFRTFLRRNKILSEAQRKGYMNLIKYTLQASRVRPRDKARISKLEKDIDKASPIADVGWLKEKVAELKG